MNDTSSPFTATTLADGSYTVIYPGFNGRTISEQVTVSAGHVTSYTHTDGDSSTTYSPENVALFDCRALRAMAHIEAAQRRHPGYTGSTFVPAGAIGKPRASRLHRVLSRLGLSHADHYKAASAALGRTVESLASITEQEGRRVWNHARALRRAYELRAA